MRRYTRSIVVAAALAFDAGHSAPGSEQAHPTGFAERIQPILDANCVACHQTGSAQQGLVLRGGLAYRNLVSQKSRESNLELIGVAVVQVYLDENRRVQNTEVVESPSAAISKAVTQAVSQWRFVSPQS